MKTQKEISNHHFETADSSHCDHRTNEAAALPGTRSGGAGRSRLRVLAVGAHPDDVELGCGGALVAHRRRGDDVAILVMTSGRSDISDHDRIAEQEQAARMLGARLMWGGFEDGCVPDGRPAVEVVEAAIRAFDADVVYTHAVHDSHQDHRATAAAVLGASRRVQRVLHYESPSTLQFNPTLFVDIDGLVETKLDLIRAHLSQVLNSSMVDVEAAEAQARYRGFASRTRNAEAFEVARFTWDLAQPVPEITGAGALVRREAAM